MAYEQRDNSGALFKNHHKDRPNQPDYRGTCMIYGKMLEMSAWLKQGSKGEFYSLSFQPPRDRQPSQEGQTEPRKAPVIKLADEGEDTVPF